METTDIWFVVFMRLRHQIAPTDWKQNQRGKTTFKFNVTQERWKDLKKEFLKDDISATKYQMEQIKDLIY